MKDFDYAKNKKNFKMPTVKMFGYDVYVWAVPIAPFTLAIEKFQSWHYNKIEWSERKAKKVLDCVLPKLLEYVEEDDAYYYCLGWADYPLYKKAPIGYKKWARKYYVLIKDYLKNNYEKENYTKTLEKEYYDTWIKFTKKA